jgi:DHA2 family methylenomycin A resistance protein-like MFS transporter
MNTKNLPLLALCCGFFMVVIDTMVVNIALPNMARDLHANISDLQWIVDGYALTFAALLLLAGNLGDRLGSKKLYIWGLSLFVLTSLGCGLSTSLGMLLICRFIQGFSAALLMPASLSLIYAAYETPKERAYAIGIWGTAAGIAAGFGPLLGGLLTEFWGWRSIFFINIPVGVAAIIGIQKWVKNTTSHKPIGFDIPGQIAIILCIASLAFGIIEAGRPGHENSLVAASFIIFGVSLLCFILIEHHIKDPMIPLKFFNFPTFSSSIFIGFCLNLYFYGILFILPLYFQQAQHYSVLLTSFAMFPLTAFSFLGGYIGGKFSQWWGARRCVLIGLILDFIAFLPILVGGTDSIPYTLLLGPLILFSLANSIAMTGTTVAAIHSLPPTETGLASAAFQTSRQIGCLLGVAILGTLMSTSLDFTKGLYIDFALGAIFCLLALGAAFLWIGEKNSPNPSLRKTDIS